MQRRFFTQSLLAAGAGSFFSALPAFAAPQDPIDTRVVTIGTSMDLSGALAAVGKEIKQGMDAAIAAANSRGGVHGREVKLVALDDGYDPARSEQNVRKLIADNNVASLLSCVGTANNQRFMPLVEEAAIPYVAPQTGASSLRKAEYRSVFHLRASYSEEATRLVQKLVSMNITDLAVVYQDSVFGQEFLADVKAALKAANLPEPKAFKLDIKGTKVAEVAQQTLAAKPSAIILGTSGVSTPALIQECKKLSPSIPMVTTSVALTGEDLRQLGSKASGLAMSMVLPDASRATLAVVREYQKVMRAAGVQEFSSRSFEGYVSTRVLLEGMERAGRDLTRARLRNALAGIRALDLGGLTIDYSASNNAPLVGTRFLDLGVIGSNGRFVA